MTNLFDPTIMRGMGYGALVGLVVVLITYALGSPWHWFRTMFWGAIIGGFAAYWPRFANLGAIVTRKPEEHGRNMVVGVLALIALAATLLIIMLGGGWLLTRCFPTYG